MSVCQRCGQAPTGGHVLMTGDGLDVWCYPVCDACWQELQAAYRTWKMRQPTRRARRGAWGRVVEPSDYLERRAR